MAKSKKMEKMSVLEEFFDNPDDSYVSPELSQDSLAKIAAQTALADMPIEQKLKSTETVLNNTILKDTVSNNVVSSKPTKELKAKETVLTNTVLDNKETVSNDTVLKNQTVAINIVSTAQTEAVNIVSPKETVSDNVVLKVNTVLNTVLKPKKAKPSFLETLILKEMIARLKDGISNFQSAEIAAEVNTTLGGVRNALNMLKRKGLIENVGYQKGNRIGFTSYKINPVVFEILSKFETKKETVLTNTVLNNTVSETVLNGSLVSKKVNSNTYIITETLKAIGLTENHLLKTTRAPEDVQELLFHFSHSIENKEIKSQNKLPVLLSVLNNPEKQWVSESYLRDIQQALAENDARVSQANELEKRKKETELWEKYQAFKQSNPEFLETVKAENLKFVKNDELADKIGFAKFVEQEQG